MKIIFTTGEEDTQNFVKKRNKVWHTDSEWSNNCLAYFKNNLKKVFPDAVIKFVGNKYLSPIGLFFKRNADEAHFILIQESIVIDFRKTIRKKK